MKVINILLIIIFILFAILGIKVYKSNSQPEYSLYDIQRILDKAKDIKNYECTIGNVHYKRKDYRIYREDESIVSISDYMYNKTISYNHNTLNSTGYIENNELMLEEINSSNRNILGDDDISKISDGIEVIDTMKERIDEKECLKVKLRLKYINSGWLASFNDAEEGTYYADIIIWINIENGLIMKLDNINKNTSVKYKYKFDTVTDEDVNPNLSKYKKVIIRDGKKIN